MTLKAMEACKHLSTLKDMEGVTTMKKKQLMKMHLQFFAESGEGSTPETTETPAINLDEINEEQLASIKEKFGFKDDDEVNKLIQSKRASWSKKLEAEKNEAARLAQLSEEERQQALIQKEKEEFEAEKEKFRQEQLFIEKGKQLEINGISPGFASRIKGDSAEEILTDVKEFSDYFNKKVHEKVEKEVNERLAGKTKTRVGGTGETLTKADIMKVKDSSERQRLIAQNRELF